MSKRSMTLGGLALLLAIGLSPGLRAAQQPPASPPQPPAPVPAPAPMPATPAAEQPAAQPPCSTCHEEAKQFIYNPHARGAVKNKEVSNDVCATCHGDGTEHIEAGGDKSKIKKPVGKDGSNETCLLCHDITTDRVSRHSGVHANSGTVNCLTCHSIHHPAPQSQHLVAKPQLELCGTCHAPQSNMVRAKPYKHRLGRGGMECSSCHEPHGRPAQETLRTTQAGEAPCLACHSNLRGPFAFPHDAKELGGCVACHEPHGSSNQKMLKRANVWQLCIECHSPGTTQTLGSQPPSFHNLNSPRYRNCTTCHTAVHGSNRSPQLFK